MRSAEVSVAVKGKILSGQVGKEDTCGAQVGRGLPVLGCLGPLE